MKKMKVFLSLCLMACMLLCFAPMRGEANAECPWDWVWDWYWGHDCRVDRWGRWYEVSFTGVKKTDAPGYSNFSFYYNQWAKTLIVRGTGDMPVFDKDHPAPWADLKDKAERVILERNITTISAQAFENFTKLKSVVLPSTLKSIDPKAFVKCENLTRLEYAGDLDNLDRVLKACGTKELTEARVVKLTEKQIKDEVWQLTWYRVGDDRIEYDRFGRPIRIVWTTPDGYRFDTAIKYLNETATNIRSEDVPGARDVVKKNETTLTFPNGFKTRSETEKNDLGQTSYASNVILDSRGRPTVGSQSFRTETGTYKTGDLSTTYYWNGSSTRTWDNTIWTGEGGSEKVVEQVNAFGQVMSVSTTTYDPNDKVVGTSETNNSYDLWGNLIATSTTSKDSGGTTSSTTTYSYDKFGRMVSSKTDGDKTGSEKFEYDKKGNLVSYTKVEDGVKTTVEYTYDKNGQKIQKTEKSGGETVRTDYTIGEKAGTETSNYTDDEGNKHKSETNYSYKGGVVSERTVKDTSSDGSTTTGKDTFNAEGLLVSSVRETVDKDGNKTTTVVTYTYDAQGRQTGMTTKSTSGSKSEKSAALAMLVSDEAASSEAKAAAMVADEGETETITTVTLDPETGVKLSEVQEVRTANYTSLTTRTFSIDGKELSVQSEITEKDGSSSNYAIDSEYDDDGKLKAQKEEISDFNNNKETSDYLYEDEKQVSQSTTRTAEDGTQTQTVSTRTYSDDGSSVDSVTEKDEDGAVTGTYTVFHDAPEETIPAAAEMTADQAKEASSGKPEEVEEEENSSDGQVPQGQEMENSGTENSSSPVSVIADAAVPLSLNSDNSGRDTKAEIIIEDPAADQTVKTDDAGKEMEKTANEEPVVKEEAATETADILFEDATAEAAPKVDDTAKNETNDAVNPVPKSETTMKESVPQSAESVSNQEPAVVEAQTQEMVPEVKEDAGLPVTEAKIETAETVPAAAEQQQPVDILAAEKPNAPAQPAIDQGALLKAAEEKSLQEAAEKAAKAAKATEEKAAQEAAEKAAQEAAEKAAKEAAEKAAKEAAEKAQKEAEEKARKEAEEKARKEAEEKARKEAEEKARKEAEEKARKEAAEKAAKEAAEKAAKEAAEKAAKEAAEKAAKDAAAQNAA